MHSTLEDEVYLNIAKESSRLSKDENTKVGAVIVDANGIHISSGRNGPPRGMNDNNIPLSREEKLLCYTENGKEITFKSNKYNFMRHAERNAIAFANSSGKTDSLDGSTIYVTHLPCPDCATDIAHYGISKVVVRQDDKHNLNSSVNNVDANHATKYIFSQQDIKLIIDGTMIDL
jgi:dCMP deaminase